MKLLIADDEKLTREGICSLLDLKQYGITEVILANDGSTPLQRLESTARISCLPMCGCPA